MPTPVEVIGVASGLVRPDNLRNIVRHRAKTLFTFAQRLLRSLALGDVVHAIDRANDGPAVIFKRPRSDDHVSPGSVFLFDHELEVGRIELLTTQHSRHWTFVAR